MRPTADGAPSASARAVEDDVDVGSGGTSLLHEPRHVTEDGLRGPRRAGVVAPAGVPDVIRQLRDREHRFVTVSPLMAPAKPQPGEVYRP
ncbi:hypothetical protein ABT316_09345 [Streptomyces cellulosae]